MKFRPKGSFRLVAWVLRRVIIDDELSGNPSAEFGVWFGLCIDHKPSAMNDLTFAFRQLVKNPGFTAVAVLSLALGIAANTTIFSFVNALLLRPPPIEKPDQLWQIWQLRPNASSELKRYGVWGASEIAFLRRHNASFTDLGATHTEPTLLTWNQDGIGQSVQSLFVTGNFFDLCGVQPVLGRFFLPEEDQTPGSHPVVVASYSFWKRHLKGDTQAVGRVISINGTAMTVIGVASEAFTGTTAGISPDLWVPFMMVPAMIHDPSWLTRIDSHSVLGLGRLKAGVNETQAAAELTTLTHRFQREVRGKIPEDGAILLPSQMVPTPLRGYVRTFTGLMMGAVFLVLLIGCANAANLQLARATARRPEMAIRSALGGSRRRLIRQLLVESVLLACLAGGTGLLLSAWLVKLILGFVPSSLPLRFALVIDWRVLGFVTAASLLTGVFFGLAPALRGTNLDIVSASKEGARGVAARRSRFASVLIAGQMALCLILLLGATLCLRSLMNAKTFDPGFEVKGRVIATVNLRDFGYTPEQIKAFYPRLRDRVRDLPGIESAAWTGYLPLGTERSNGNYALDSTEPGGSRHGFLEQFSAGPGYFATLGTKLLRGREFTDADLEGAPRVAIINEAAANRYWPGADPIGRRIYLSNSAEPRPEDGCEIVGVVQTGRYRTLGEDPKPAFFQCFLQSTPSSAVLVAHAQSDPAAALQAILREAQALDTRLALTQTTTLEQHLTLALFPMRMSGTLLGVLGLVALVLAAAGLFGVIAYSVSQRTREIGIRMALGAQRSDVQRSVLRQGMQVTLAGVLLGLVGAFGAARLLRNLLFGVSSADPATFVCIPIFLLAIAGCACWLPARRAARLNPMAALRNE